MFELLPNFRESVAGRVVPSVLLLLSALCSVGCQAPQPVIQADDLATQIEDEYVAAVQARLSQWRKELGHSWEKELGYVLQREMSAKAEDSGSIPVEEVLRVLALQAEARRKNLQRLELEGEADRAATAGWRESRRIRESIRRWMQAGMSKEDRDKIVNTALEVANDRAK